VIASSMKLDITRVMNEKIVMCGLWLPWSAWHGLLRPLSTCSSDKQPDWLSVGATSFRHHVLAAYV
jgi:hypothetical protein